VPVILLRFWLLSYSLHQDCGSGWTAIRIEHFSSIQIRIRIHKVIESGPMRILIHKRTDPDSEYGSGSVKVIESGHNTDLDPQVIESGYKRDLDTDPDPQLCFKRLCIKIVILSLREEKKQIHFFSFSNSVPCINSTVYSYGMHRTGTVFLIA
jgi:hypothetical protein